MKNASVLGLVLTAVGMMAQPSVAEACGGCFGPVDNPQVVTDHRMVMAIHARESILWDQIRYTGRPEDFSWVLPVAGDVRVELASGEFFDRLEAVTRVQVRGPFVNTSCGGAFRGGFGAPSSAAADAGAAEDHGVTVVREEVVGPYQTVTLRSTDPSALTTWLRSNAYVIPESIQPVIDYYVERHMDFLALRLRPGEGVNAMQPVRVRYATANMVLPLRMVAAGIGDKVGITLWVFGNGRFEAGNFANGTIRESDLVWDWTNNRSNYNDVFDATLRGLAGGRAWITQLAQEAGGYRWQFDNPYTSDAGAAREDWLLATQGNADGVWLTRMRTDLAARFLDTDLQLQASTTSASVSNFLRATREVGARPQPVCPSSGVVGFGGGATIGTARCSASPGRGARGGGAVGLLAGAVALAAVRRRRARL
jgi:hypothetical protein